MEISDDENETPSGYFPPLRLYHKAQTDGQWAEISAKHSGAPVTESKQCWRAYRNLRFYSSLIGFHEGSLDLSGRHQARYKILRTAWDQYLCDFQELRPTMIPVWTEVQRGPFTVKELEYNVLNWELWDLFQAKWHIHSSFGVSLFPWTDDVMEAMRLNPEPKIQDLCLQQLPVELIQEIYEACSQADARILSSTSHYMRSLGLPYIFGARSVTLDPGRRWLNKLTSMGASTQDGAFQFLQQVAGTSCTKYVQTLEFLISRSDLTRSLTSLSLVNLWVPASQFDNSLAEGFAPTLMDSNFYLPIHQHNRQLLQTTINLTDLRIMGLEITTDFLRVTTQLPSLCELSFELCSLTNDLQRLALEPDPPKYEKVLSLTIDLFHLRFDNHRDPWYLLPFCPKIQKLAVGGFRSISGNTVPPLELWNTLNPFRTLKKFSMVGLVAQDVALLGGWIRNASRVEECPIPMTHFKVETKWDFDLTEMGVLLSALSSAPDLQVCVFDGLRSDLATTLVIRLITHFIPNILGLTLIVNEQMRNSGEGLCAWPSPMWAYGSHFASFSRLEYFGWNNRFDPEVTPAEMSLMEEGYPDDDSPESWMRANERGDESFLYDFERTGAVFGAYCPSIKAIGYGDGQYMSRACSIARSEHGMVVKSYYTGERECPNIRKWNTLSFQSQGW